MLNLDLVNLHQCANEVMTFEIIYKTDLRVAHVHLLQQKSSHFVCVDAIHNYNNATTNNFRPAFYWNQQLLLQTTSNKLNLLYCGLESHTVNTSCKFDTKITKIQSEDIAVLVD